MITASAPCRSGSACQRSSASAKRRQADSASASSQLPGNWMTPNLMSRWPARPRAPRSPRSAGSPAAARTSPEPPTGPRRRAPPAYRHARSPRPRSRAPAARARRPGPADRGFPPWAGSEHAPGSRRPAPLEPCLERLARDPLVGLRVAGPGPVHDLGRKRRRRRRLVPAGLRRPVAHVLLVEARLRPAGLVAGGRPEARGIGRQNLVGEHDRAVGAAAQLELGVGEEDAVLARVGGGELVQLDRDAAELLQQRPVADDLSRPVEVDVLVVVAYVGLGGLGEDRLRELLRLLESLGQADAAHGPGGLVVLPAGPRQVAADHALDRDHLEPLHEHPAAPGVARHVRIRDEVVRADVLRTVEPEDGQAGEHPSLVRDGRGVHHVVRGDPVGGDHQQAVLPDRVDVPDLALRDQLEVLERGGFAHSPRLHRGAVDQPTDQITTLDWRPRTSISSTRTRSSGCARSAARVESDRKIMCGVPLVMPSSREAVLVVSPITVYSKRSSDPTVPAMTAPLLSPTPIRNPSPWPVPRSHSLKRSSAGPVISRAAASARSA